MSISFCIITNGRRPELLETVIRSIREQQVPTYEIIIAGVYRPAEGITYVAAEAAAAAGRLGELRNRAVALARYDHVVMLDDDIILAPGWYAALSASPVPFDIVTSRIMLPDGGRYYDHVTAGGPRGHVFLDDADADDHVYMTGGGGWVMRQGVAQTVAWDSSRGFYQDEDIDFSRRCQARGYTISHNPAMVVFHADPTYTSVGRVVKRRKNGRSQEWVLHEFGTRTVMQLFWWVVRLRLSGEGAESDDVIRMAILRGKGCWLFALLLQMIVARWGGDLAGTSWSPTGASEYLRALERYRPVPGPEGDQMQQGGA